MYQITLPFIRDGRRLLDVFRGLDYPAEKVRLIVNRHEKRGDIGIDQVERTLCTPVTRAIPNHYAAAAASVNQGIPMVVLVRGNPISRALLQWGRSWGMRRCVGLGCGVGGRRGNDARASAERFRKQGRYACPYEPRHLSIHPCSRSSCLNISMLTVA